MATSRTSENADRRFVRKAMNKPMLSAEHEHDLALRWRDDRDEEALHELTSAYMRLVISMASKFRHYGLALPDLVQEGNVGLMQAAARFDPDREVRFSTYASWWIRSSIQDFVLRNWSIVRTGTTAAQKSLFFNLKRLRAKIDDTGDGTLTPENKTWIATHLGVKEREVETMASRLSASDRSLNAPLSTDSEAQWQDLLEDENSVTEDRVMASRDGERRKQWIAEALRTLTERENLIIRERRLTDDTVTLEVLGKRLGISKERVRQIEHRALGKLRNALVSMVGDPEETGLIPVG